jgi:hypothetical protein
LAGVNHEQSYADEDSREAAAEGHDQEESEADAVQGDGAEQND